MNFRRSIRATVAAKIVLAINMTTSVAVNIHGKVSIRLLAAMLSRIGLTM